MPVVFYNKEANVSELICGNQLYLLLLTDTCKPYLLLLLLLLLLLSLLLLLLLLLKKYQTCIIE